MTRRTERLVAAAVVLLVAIGVTAFIVWNQRAQEEFERDRVYIPPDVQLTPEAKLLQEYVRLQTTAGNEMQGARWLANVLAKNGVKAEIIESAPGRGNVYARIRGKKQGSGLLLLHHIDVIAADPKNWKLPPFSGEPVLASIYGRGALDMKGIGLTHLFAFLDVAKSGRVPEHDLVFLAVADEEARGALGMRWLLEHRPDVFDGIQYGLNEGGVTEMTAEQVVYYGIEIGSTLYADLTVAAPTMKQYREARFALQKYVSPREPERITPEVRRFFRDISPTRQAYGKYFADIDRTVAEGDFWRLPAPYRVLTQNTAMLEWPRPVGNEFHATLHLLYLPDADPRERIRWAAETIAPFGLRVVDEGEYEEPVPFSSIDTPLYGLIASEAKKTFGGTVGTMILHRNLNDSRFLRRRGIVMYGVLPFRVDTFQSRSIHGVDERIRIDWFMEGVGFMKRLVRGYVLGGQ